MPAMALLKLDPQDTLSFQKGTSSTKTLKLTNVSSGNVAFKVKTKRPESCTVRPGKGTLTPHETQEVTIQHDGSDGANSHCFQVQAVSIEHSGRVTVEEWNNFPKGAVENAKLDVVLEEEGAKEATGKGKIDGDVSDKDKQGKANGGKATLEEKEEEDVQAAGKEKIEGGVSDKEKKGEASGGKGAAASLEDKDKADLQVYARKLEQEKRKLEEPVEVLETKLTATSAAQQGWQNLHVGLMVAFASLIVFFLTSSAQ